MRFVRFVLFSSSLSLGSLASAQTTPDAPQSPAPIHGFAIQFFTLKPQHLGIDDGLYEASVTVTPVSMANVELPKFWFFIDNVRSIDDLREKVKPRIIKEAEYWINSLREDEDAFKKKGLSPSPVIDSRPAIRRKAD